MHRVSFSAPRSVSSWRTACVALAMMWLGGCGGGGGGGGDAAPATPAVTVGAPSLATVGADVLVGGTLPNVVLTGTVSGDLAALSGRQVFVIVEDPAGLFQPTASLQLQPSGAVWTYTLTLQGQALATTGRRSGNLRLFVCLDPQCGSRLNGTPITIAFDVNVVPGLVIGQHAINITVPFGTVPDEQAVDVTLSSLSTSWVASDPTPFNPALTKTLVIIDDGRLSTSSQVRFRLLPAIPGTYTERVRVHTDATIGINQIRDFDEYIDITYTVTPNPAIDHVFSPASLSVTQSASDTLIRQSPGYMLVTNFGTLQSFAGVVYAPNVPFDWWSVPNETHHVCESGPGGLICLQPGVYTVHVRYQLSGVGTGIVEIPITLTVTP